MSSEVERMERVVGCKTIYQGGEMEMESERVSKQASCREWSIGEERAKELMKGDHQSMGGSGLVVQTVGNDCSPAQRNDVCASEHRFSSSSISSLSSYIPPTPRYNNPLSIILRKKKTCCVLCN